MKNVRIVFQGDSITDAGRNRDYPHHLGYGYANYASESICKEFPDTEFEFLNFGISANRTSQLFDRIYTECISYKPDIVSVMIGINDIWHRYEYTKILTSDEQIALNYRSILKRLKSETAAKIIILAPYVLDSEDKNFLRGDLERLLRIVREMANEYADAYIPLDRLFAEALKTQPCPKYYSADGIHPNENGAKFIAEHYTAAIKTILTKQS